MQVRRMQQHKNCSLTYPNEAQESKGKQCALLFSSLLWFYSEMNCTVHNQLFFCTLGYFIYFGRTLFIQATAAKLPQWVAVPSPIFHEPEKTILNMCNGQHSKVFMTYRPQSFLTCIQLLLSLLHSLQKITIVIHKMNCRVKLFFCAWTHVL